MSIALYGIPTCNSCKKARKWLTDRNIDHTWIDLRATPPSNAQIRNWVNTLGTKPLKNTSGGSYRALGEEKKTWTDEQWIAAFTADPMLLKRPIVVKDNAALFTGFRGTDDEIGQRFGIH